MREIEPGENRRCRFGDAVVICVDEAGHLAEPYLRHVHGAVRSQRHEPRRGEVPSKVGHPEPGRRAKPRLDVASALRPCPRPEILRRRRYSADSAGFFAAAGQTAEQEARAQEGGEFAAYKKRLHRRSPLHDCRLEELEATRGQAERGAGDGVSGMIPTSPPRRRAQPNNDSITFGD
jgi:hypothetical protein